MNKFTRDMLMAKYDRARNPYGSRGGYVDGRSYSSSDNRAYSSNDTMIREPQYSMPDDRFEHLERRRMEDHNRDYNSDYRSYDRDYNRGYDRAYERDYNRDYRGYERDYRSYDRDYGETEYGRMSRQDIEKWKHSFKNADGTTGEHFKKEQIEPMIKRLGIDVEKMGGEEVFTLVVNMMYADYCQVAKKFGLNQPDFYVDMAKAFLTDKDFKGNPEEKIWLYYKCIAESEE